MLEDLIRLRTSSLEPEHPTAVTTAYSADGTRIVEGYTTQDDDDNPQRIAQQMGVRIPDGFTAHIVEARHDPAAWHRSNQGDDAVTRPVVRYRLRIEPDTRPPRLPLADLLDLIGQPITHTPIPTASSDAAYLVLAGDLQLGKVDQGGTAAAVTRFLTAHQASITRWLQLFNAGEVGTHVLLVWAGDVLEGNVSQGGNLAAAGRTDLTITEQLRVWRKLLTRQVLNWLDLGVHLTITVTPGNHDEAERRGRITRSPLDSWAIEGAASVADLIDSTPHAGSTTWVLPEPDRLTTTLEVAGTRIGVAHGHQIPGGKVHTWLANQALARDPIGTVDLLITGHRHKLHLQQLGPTLHIQIPALETGADHHDQRHGGGEPGGLITLTTCHRSWGNLTQT